MISKIFFKGKVEDNYMYSEEYVKFIVSKELYMRNGMTLKDVEKYLLEVYGNNLIKINYIEYFCNSNYVLKEDKYYINSDKQSIFQKLLEYYNNFEQYINTEKKELYKALNDKIGKAEFEIDEIIKQRICLQQIVEDNVNKEEALYIYYEFQKRYIELYREIDIKLDKIDKCYDEIELKYIINNKLQIKLLLLNGIETIKELKQLSVSSIICIFVNSENELLKILTQYSKKQSELEESILEKIELVLSENEKRILHERFSCDENEKKKSLAEISISLNITRERVRQIERKAINKILINSEELELLIYMIYINSCKSNKMFLTRKVYEDKIEEPILKKYIMIFLENSNFFIKYSSKYDIIFNEEKITLKELEEDTFNNMRKYIPEDDIATFNTIQEVILKEKYRLFEDVLYMRKELNKAELYIDLIKEKFPGGYHISSKDDYEIICNTLKEKYGDNIKVISQHSINAMIDRSGFIIKDKGTYIAKEHSVKIPKPLLEKIIEFILESENVVFYRTIFSKFKEELNKIGIHNHFYLKGCIDSKLPVDFLTKRDYITFSKCNETPSDLIISILRSFDGEFDIEDLMCKLPGLKEYSYNSYISKENINGLIKVSTNTYIYYNKKNISNDTENELKEFIKNMFIQLDTNVLSSKKIYAKLAITNRPLLEKLNLKGGQVELFSIIQYLYKDFFYSRPFISNEKEFLNTRYLLISNYAKTLDIFTSKDIADYTYKMNIGGLCSYLNFMEELSDEYIQIEIDTMMKKELLDINEQQLRQVDNLVDLLLSNYNYIDMETFKGYSLLPRLSKKWNKYLLVGIIRTYLSEKYQIEYTDNTYNKTNFIIRRI